MYKIVYSRKIKNAVNSRNLCEKAILKHFLIRWFNRFDSGLRHVKTLVNTRVFLCVLHFVLHFVLHKVVKWLCLFLLAAITVISGIKLFCKEK